MDRIREIIIKVPKSIKIALVMILLLIDLIGMNLASQLEKIEIYDVAAAYNTLVAFFPTASVIAKEYRYIFIILTLLAIVLLFYRPKLILVKHRSFVPDIASVNQDVLEKYYVKKMDINLCEAMKEPNTYVNAINIQDQIAAEIMKKRNSSKLCYYGIAHTPLIFRLGFQMGDQNNIMLLHKIRSNDSLFDEWNRGNTYSTIRVVEKNESVQSAELIVAISTSLEIKDSDLASLNPGNRHVITFESSILSFDSITSYSQAENFRNTIMHGIRDCVKKYGIKKIHITISSSVAFTFFLGQAFSEQHDPVLVVYHYERGSYPWGICINEKAESALVANINVNE